uniref:Glycosyltransferase family 25 LPS biosynthesis protein n=1 Tax=Marseillevirus LCMAC201 TaxID=2506605 RepID=A0A481YY53_9VIRU|nr:MAG: glycosyltransferase family 25 LPS biosynthesis protein [Marseillevirus LCMAC201]
MLTTKTLTELRIIAKKKQLPGYSTLDKSELIRYIKTGHRPKSNSFNRFFNKIYVINLKGKQERWTRVHSAFRRRGIKVERFEAVDGRCKGKQCENKRRQFEKEYNIKIPKKGLNLPSSSLLIGTILILREMVKNKWDHVLICEDDIVLGRDVKAKFAQGVRELNKAKPNWDLLYLGCGNKCGVAGISESRNTHSRYLSEVSKHYPDQDPWYVARKDDLRGLCNDDDDDEDEDYYCPVISKHLSIAPNPKGTWCYGYSLKGAKKFLKYVDNHIDDHVDQLLSKAVIDGKLVAVAFNPPIVWHYLGASRPDSDIAWEW